MTPTERIIRECIAKKITDKRAMAKVYVEQYPEVPFEYARRRIRKMLGSSGNLEEKRETELYKLYMDACSKSTHYEEAQKKELKKSKVYLITSALNNTPVHMPFWNNLLKYAEFLGAEIHVVALRYKNPTSVFSDRKEDVWVKEVLPYLDAKRHELFPGTILMSDVKISPTAVLPLSGLNGFSGDESCIFGHPRVHLQSQPVLKGCNPKMMLTTGVCTLPNYTDSKAGKKGEFHHTYGFTVATEDGLHYVTAKDNGDFIDYRIMVTSEGIYASPPVEALVLGDIHHAKLSEDALVRIEDRITTLKPKRVVLHDVFDGESINPHDDKDPVKKVKRYESGRADLSYELDEALSFLSWMKGLCDNIMVVPSNHDSFLDRYMANMDWRKDIPNAIKYAELLPIALKEDGVFRHLIQQIGIYAPSVNDSIKVHGVELNTHGDRGANGTRGSSVQFKNMSFKMIKAHDHTPSRLDGCSSVGCQDLDHGYNEGLSSWGIADIAVDAFGKIQHYFGK